VFAIPLAFGGSIQPDFSAQQSGMGKRISASSLDPELGPDELICLRDLIRNSGLPGRHLEIGTAAGGTLCAMMNCFAAEQRPPFVVVDSMAYFTDQLEVVKQNLRQHGLDPAQVDIRVAKSFDAFQSAEAAGETFDFVFIDGAHKIRYVTQDLRWSRLVNVGGLICVHDYTPKQPGVVRAVNRFLHQHPNYERVALVNTLLVLRKRAASQAQEISRIDSLWALVMSPWIQLQQSLAKRLAK
jgi:predicted O-methyltransferase YrrM